VKISQGFLFFFFFSFFFFSFFFELPEASLEKLCFGGIDPTETVAALRFDVALWPVVDGLVQLEKKKEKRKKKKNSKKELPIQNRAGGCLLLYLRVLIANIH
jgi:hypothetical protein